MKNIIEFYQHFVGLLEKRAPVVMATVISRSGSGPREAGALMLIRKDGEIFGTVGGGGLEAQVLELARRVFESSRPICETFSLTNSQASEEGMVCGGTVEVLMDPVIEPDPTVLRIHKNTLEDLERGRSLLVVTSICRHEDRFRTGVGLVRADGVDPGTLEPPGLDAGKFQSKLYSPAPVLTGKGDLRYFLHPLRAPETVYIFGAGHVGEALVPICSHAGFAPVVLDDRNSFADPERFPDAAEIRVIDDYAGCLKDLPVNENSYLIIVTRGHIHDQTVLAQALRTGAKYIGMIGSRRKREILYAALRKDGFSEPDIGRVHCPIGIGIGAQTPAEIAVSIVAEMIAVRKGQGASMVKRGKLNI